VINLPAAINRLFGSPGVIGPSSNLLRLFESDAIDPRSDALNYCKVTRQTDDEQAVSFGSAARATEPAETFLPTAPSTGSVRQSTAHSGLVYAIGRLSFDLASVIGRQTLEQRMAQDVKRGELIGANPDEPRDLIAYLDKHPDERRNIVWTLEMDGGPVYALEPKGPYADEIYETLLRLLAGQLLPQDVTDFVERVSIPGLRSGRTVGLLSKAKVPIVVLADVRGIYGWKMDALVKDAVASATQSASSNQRNAVLYDAIADFLRRVYFDLRNYGLTSRDRAMNFAATNCFQAVSAFAKALADGRVLETISVEKSPVCRMHSDCWEIYLNFYDPDDAKRATQVFNFTIDVSDIMPVTVGTTKSWMRRRLN
jgi:thiazoline dehydrogenase / protease